MAYCCWTLIGAHSHRPSQATLDDSRLESNWTFNQQRLLEAQTTMQHYYHQAILTRTADSRPTQSPCPGRLLHKTLLHARLLLTHASTIATTPTTSAITSETTPQPNTTPNTTQPPGGQGYPDTQ
eukprot:scaffold104125_cov35-Prasinocladus_malaysianus.AAC.1